MANPIFIRVGDYSNFISTTVKHNVVEIPREQPATFTQSDYDSNFLADVQSQPQLEYYLRQGRSKTPRGSSIIKTTRGHSHKANYFARLSRNYP